MLPVIRGILENARHIAVLTGAGVSTASGIPDFRSSEGLWTEDKSREELMSVDFFHENPVEFWRHYKSIFRLKLLQNYGPNEVHRFVRALESNGRRVDVITQNVDGLHAAADSEHVIEYHGTLKTATCPVCHRTYPLSHVLEEEIPRCVCGDILKPDVVLFGDMIPFHKESEHVVRQADVTLVLGTSLTVMPFNRLPMVAGGTKILMNNHPTSNDHLFDYCVHEDLTKIVHQLQE